MPRRKLDHALPLPPDPPAGVAEPFAHFDELVTRLAEARGERYDLRDAIDRAKREDSEAAVAAALEGQPIKDADLDKRERAARAKLAACEARLPALEQATIQAGEALLPIIEQHRDEWLTRAEQHRDQARERYDAAIAEAQRIAAELAAARSAVDWLEGFTAADFLAGGPIFHRDRPLRVEDARGHEHDVVRLLALAATVTTAKPERTLRGPLTGQPQRIAA